MPRVRSSAIVADDSAPIAAPEVSSPSVAPPTVRAGEPILGTEPFEPRHWTAPAQTGLHQGRFTIKAGYYSSEDAEELDDGYIANLSWMQFVSSFFALELEVGYFGADGEDGGIDADVWGIPAMVNGRFNLPVWVLDLYGGVGVGAIYYDVETSGAVSADSDGFLFGGNAFVGATINLADRIALGLEAKYYLTEEIDDVDAALDAFALMLTLGFSRER
jgi:hypothetical protein